MGTRLPLMAVDLDGTLIRGNSLHEYIRCGLRHGSLSVRLRLLGALALRKLRLCSHVAMKRRALAAIRPDADFDADFCRRIDSLRRREVETLMRQHVAAGGITVVATAASALYVSKICEGDCVCTDAECAVECRGAEKLRRVLAFADERGAEPAVVVTDHPDDLPLLTYPGVRRVIVGSHPALTEDKIAADIRIH